MKNAEKARRQAEAAIERYWRKKTVYLGGLAAASRATREWIAGQYRMWKGVP